MKEMQCLQKDKSERLMVVSVLSCLYEEEDYGYQLLAKLSRFGIDVKAVRPATLYRVLRKLEEQGMIASRWTDSSQGPNQRLYTITPQGFNAYLAWLARLKERQHQIYLLLDKAKEQGVIQ